MTVPGLPPYESIHVLDLFTAIAIGIVAALFLAGVRMIGGKVRDLRRGPLGMPGLLLAGALAGALAVGLLAQPAELLGDNSQDVLFSGQSALPAEVQESSVRLLIILVVAKGLGCAVSLGCGFRGGPVFPAIFLGVGLATIAVDWFDLSPTLAVAVGTAADMAAMTRLLFASLLFAALLVGSQGLNTIPAAVLAAAAAAWVTTAALAKRSTPSGGRDQ